MFQHRPTPPVCLMNVMMQGHYCCLLPAYWCSC